ncbi:MAG: hypothetical protein F9K32_08200 [Desulfobulbaceae bacterium]|nr:MAG: hypothetical protein F9K32_08200 [Desulfobulbaceae bacterium]
MLEKFDNHLPPEGDLRPRWQRRWKSAVLCFFLVPALLVGVGAAVRHDLFTSATHSLSTAIASMERHFAHGVSREAVVDFLRDLGPGENSSRQSIPESDTSAQFLYTVELADGGRVEGRVITVDRETITVTDKRGVVIEIARSRVARITRIRL